MVEAVDAPPTRPLHLSTAVSLRVMAGRGKLVWKSRMCMTVSVPLVLCEESAFEAGASTSDFETDFRIFIVYILCNGTGGGSLNN